MIAKKKNKVRGSSQAIHGKEIGEKNILLVGAIINKGICKKKFFTDLTLHIFP